MINNSIDCNIEGVVKELAQLSEVDYQYQRKDVGKQLGVPLVLLDKLVKKERCAHDARASEIFPVIEAWHEEVNGKALLDELEKTINRFIAFPSSYEAKAITLHILFTYCTDVFDYSPILNVCSPEKRCGKSTLLSVLKRLVNRPLIASNISPAAIFRSIDKLKPTLILDEADTFLLDNEEMRGVINSGHERESAYVIRCVGDKHEAVRFNTWCPKVIAGIGRLPETIEDRSIVIQLRRKLSNEKKVKLRDISKLVFQQLVQKCMRFVADNMEVLGKIKPAIPEILNDRAADNWSPLVAIAKLAGDEWLKVATEAAVQLSDIKRESISVGVELLQDIKNIFAIKNLDRLYTHELLEALYADIEAPWVTYNQGKPLTARQLASQLKKYSIHSKDMRIPPLNRNLKGYAIDDFSETFSRYLSSCSQEGILSATTRQTNNDSDLKGSCISDKDSLLRIEDRV